MSPAGTPAGSPAFWPVELFAPSVEVNIDPLSNSAPAPLAEIETSQESPTIDLEAFEVHFEAQLDTLMAGPTTAGESSSSAGGYFRVIAVVVLAMVAVLSVGILFGRLWQRRRDGWQGLPFVDKDDDLRDETSFDRRVRHMN